MTQDLLEKQHRDGEGLCADQADERALPQQTKWRLKNFSGLAIPTVGKQQGSDGLWRCFNGDVFLTASSDQVT